MFKWAKGGHAAHPVDGAVAPEYDDGYGEQAGDSTCATDALVAESSNRKARDPPSPVPEAEEPLLQLDFSTAGSTKSAIDRHSLRKYRLKTVDILLPTTSVGSTTTTSTTTSSSPLLRIVSVHKSGAKYKCVTLQAHHAQELGGQAQDNTRPATNGEVVLSMEVTRIQKPPKDFKRAHLIPKFGGPEAKTTLEHMLLQLESVKVGQIADSARSKDRDPYSAVILALYSELRATGHVNEVNSKGTILF